MQLLIHLAAKPLSGFNGFLERIVDVLGEYQFYSLVVDACNSIYLYNLRYCDCP